MKKRNADFLNDCVGFLDNTYGGLRDRVGLSLHTQ